MSLRYSHQAPRQPSMVINTVNNKVYNCAFEYQPARKIMSAVRSA
jgi:hypothetical protein